MKNFYLIFVLTATVLSITSCKKDDPKLGIFTAKIADDNGDFINWSATKETIVIHAGAPLNIIGRDDNSTLIINLQDVDDIGTYLINDTSLHFARYTIGPGTFETYKNYYFSHGEVILTELSDSKVKGTFFLKLSNSFEYKTISDGEFEIEIQ